MRIDIVNLEFGYHVAGGDRLIFRNTSASFVSGRFYALMGPSGSGKTSLFRLLTRQLNPDKGQILFDDQDLSNISVRELRSTIVGQIFQDYVLIPFLTPVENLLLAREITKGRADGDDQQRALYLLERVGLTHHADRAVESLSGGEQQRVAVARAMMGSARILLADEPTGALDDQNTDQIAELLASLAHNESVTVIAGTHDQNFAHHADSVIRIHDRHLVTE